VAERAAGGLYTSAAEVAAARWLDAEDATTRQALAWAMEHDRAVALRLAVALAPWWLLRGRMAGGYPQLCEAASGAAAGSEVWCAAQFWLGPMAIYSPGLAVALDRLTALPHPAAGRGAAPPPARR